MKQLLVRHRHHNREAGMLYKYSESKFIKLGRGKWHIMARVFDLSGGMVVYMDGVKIAG